MRRTKSVNVWLVIDRVFRVQFVSISEHKIKKIKLSLSMSFKLFKLKKFILVVCILFKN